MEKQFIYQILKEKVTYLQDGMSDPEKKVTLLNMSITRM